MKAIQAIVGAIWRRLTVGALEDVGTVLEGWHDDARAWNSRQARAVRATLALDQPLVVSSHLVGPGGTVVVRHVDAETAATLRRERQIAAMIADGLAMKRAETQGCWCVGVHTCGRFS